MTIFRGIGFAWWGYPRSATEADPKLRTYARLKNDNSFPFNKGCVENRAFMRGLGEKLALLRTGSRPSDNLALFGIFPCSRQIGLLYPVQYGMVTI